ncbi:MAG: response regulator, partial [Candidatus Eisenbacteria bacterium]|nr:response regulator [Candidatus Eisenbacteria bacterium]
MASSAVNGISQRPGPVIMVDDNDIDLAIAERCFRQSGLAKPLIQLTGGRELLAYLREVEDGRETMPSLVLLDINMPGFDGFETLQAVRNNAIFQEIPIVMMLTNSDRPEDWERARDLGADGF